MRFDAFWRNRPLSRQSFPSPHLQPSIKTPRRQRLAWFQVELLSERLCHACFRRGMGWV